MVIGAMESILHVSDHGVNPFKDFIHIISIFRMGDNSFMVTLCLFASWEAV